MTAARKHDKSEIKPDFQAVKLNVTRFYRIEKEDTSYIDAIWDVFMYDKNTHTYCCEMTPSYFLIHLYTTVVFKDELCKESDAVSESIRDRIDQRYCFEPTDDCYMHVSDIDELPLRDKTNYAEPFEDEEDAREYMCGNCPF